MNTKKIKLNVSRTRQQNQNSELEKGGRRNCACSNVYSANTNVESRKSRLTIFGQLGKTENNKYIWQCAAKINDKPIPMDSWPINKRTTDEDHLKKLKDVASHAVQVNFGVAWNDHCCHSNNNHQAIQCNFINAKQGTKEENGQDDDKGLRKCNSPIVIISVYQRPDATTSFDKITNKTKPNSKKNFSSLDRNQKRINKIDIYNNKANSPRVRSRTPSPTPKKNSNKKVEKKVEASMQYETPKQSVIARKMINKKSTSQVATKGYSEKNDRNTNTKTQQVNEKNTKKVKKALVDNFIKNIDQANDNYSKYFLSVPKSNASKVTINLTGGTEHYDIVVKEDCPETNLLVRKLSHGKKDNRNKESKTVASMEKFLTLANGKKNHSLPDKRKERPNSVSNTADDSRQKRSNIQSCGMKTCNSQLKFRDSLEIKYSLVGRSGEMKEKSENKNISSAGFTELTRHHRGDKCSIQNPIIRDKEIRELLGLLNQNKEKKYNSKSSENFGKVPIKTKCSKAIMTKMNFTRLKFSSSCGNIRNNRMHKRLFKKLEYDTENINMPTLISTYNNRDLIDNRQIFNVDTYKDRTQPESFDASQNLKHMNLLLDAIRETSQPITMLHNLVNRNIQVFLQLEQPLTCRCINLSKIQCNKLKKKTGVTVLNKSSKRNYEKKSRVYSNDAVEFGNGIIKRKCNKSTNFDKGVQTEYNENGYNTKCIQTEVMETSNKEDIIIHTNNKKYNCKQLSNDLKDDMKGTVRKVDSERKVNKSVGPRLTVSSSELHRINNAKLRSKTYLPQAYHKIKGDDLDSHKHTYVIENSRTIHTIFKGGKRSPTPNLGTSFCSIHPTTTLTSRLNLNKNKIKLKKTFLQRFMSCLFKRFNRNSDVSFRNKKPINIRSVSAATDSYYINTSLGPWEMSSDLYDTSESFFSRHTVLPATKTRKSFMNSVRGLLNRQTLQQHNSQ